LNPAFTAALASDQCGALYIDGFIEGQLVLANYPENIGQYFFIARER